MKARGDLAEYALAVRSFSRNARLFIVHVIGMDTVHGTSLVLVNLYFLAVGLPIEFIGLRRLLGGIVPLLAASLADKVTLYRASIFIGITIWALSLIPALMLRGHDRPIERGAAGVRNIFAAVRHPDRVLRLVA